MGKRGEEGFTLIELLVVIAIIAILAAILFPIFLSVRVKAYRVKCLSNMRQIAIAIRDYASEYDNCTPLAFNPADWNIWWDGTFRERIQPYLRSTDVLLCPVDTKEPRYGGGRPISHYGMNVYVTLYNEMDWGFCRLATISKPAETILVSENHDGDWSAEPWDNAASGHEGQFYPYHSFARLMGGNFIFCDTHTNFLSVYETQKNNFYLWRTTK